MVRSIGIHEDWTATPPGRTPAQVRVRYPKSGLGRCFTGKPLTTVQDLRPKVLETLKPYLDAGTKTIYISIKTDIVQTQSGAWDARYLELGKYIFELETKYQIQIVVIPWHEPEDNFTNGVAFVKYYNQAFYAIKAGSSLVKVKPCFMAYHWAPGSTGSVKGKTDKPSEWFDGLQMQDGVIIDVYSGRTFPLEQILPEHPGFARFVKYLPSTVRYNLGERGWETPSATFKGVRSSVRAFTMDREFDWLISTDPVAARCDDYTIWSSPGTENAPGLIMDTAGENKIDDFFLRAFKENPLPSPVAPAKPNEDDPQFQFGYKAGRKSAFVEMGDAADSKLATER